MNNKDGYGQHFSFKGSLFLVFGVFFINVITLVLFRPSQSVNITWFYAITTGFMMSFYIAYLTVFYERNGLDNDKKVKAFLLRGIIIGILLSALTHMWASGIII